MHKSIAKDSQAQYFSPLQYTQWHFNVNSMRSAIVLIKLLCTYVCTDATYGTQSTLLATAFTSQMSGIHIYTQLNGIDAANEYVS